MIEILSASQRTGSEKRRTSRRFSWVASALSEPVDDDVQTQPHHIHEVPVPRRAFETEVTRRREVALHESQCDEQQHQHTDEHVEAVEASEHEEGRAVDARAELQIQL